MWKNAGVAVGAGLASGLLFAVSATGSFAAMAMAYLTALPIVIAALGYGQRFGLAGAAVGIAGVSTALGPVLGIFYAVSFALPAWWLSFLARSTNAASAKTGGRHPPGLLVIWAVGLSSATVLAFGAVAVWRFGGFTEAGGAISHRIADELGRSPGGQGLMSEDGLPTLLVQVLPLALAASSCLMLLLNLWLGARVTQVSQRLPRPWPNVPDGLRLPRWSAVALAACAAIGFAAGLQSAAGATASTVAAALALAFGLQGLGTVHVLTRGIVGRLIILGLAYGVIVVLPLAAVAPVLLGLADCLLSIRSRFTPPKPPTKSKGVSSWT